MNRKTTVSAHDNFRYALIDGLGRTAADRCHFTVASKIDGCIDAGIACFIQEASLYLLVRDADHTHDAATASFWMLDMAIRLTNHMKTFVAPAQSSISKTYWSGKDGHPVNAYMFTLLDRPISI